MGADNSQPEPDSQTGAESIDVPEFSVDNEAQPTPMILDAVTLADPGSIAFLDEVSVEIAVANAGGAAITQQFVEFGLEYTGRADSPHRQTVAKPDSVSVELPELDSGEWTTVKAQFQVNAEGDWRLTSDARTHPSFDHQITVEPKRLVPGESVTSKIGRYEITAREPRFEHALHYETEEGGVGLFNKEATGLVSSGDGEILVVHRFTIENTSKSRSLGFGTVLVDNQFANATVTGTPGDIVNSDDMRDSLSTLVLPGNAEPLGDNKVGPGQVTNLVAVQSVPIEELSNASLTLSLWGNTNDIVFESPSDIPAVPQFELIEARMNEGSDGPPVMEMTVRNTSDASGTFRGAGQFYETRPTAPDWVYLPEGVEASLGPGESETLRIPASRGNEKYRILPFETELRR